MSDSQNLSQQDWQQQEDLIAQFEAAFQQGKFPQIEKYICQEEANQFTLLIELVHIDLEQRLKARESVRVEEYLTRFPVFLENPESLRELIAAEYIFRLRTQFPPDLMEYTKRFPQLSKSLISHLQQVAKKNDKNQKDSTAYVETVIQSEYSTQSQINNQSTLSPNDYLKRNQSEPEYGRYVIKKTLGEGASGKVLLAHDPVAKRDVALKVPKWRLEPDSEEYERFLREARAIAAMRHQNICQLYDLLKTENNIVLVMPFFKGGSLAEKLNKHKFSLEESIKLTIILASAMAYVHDASVVHRDLKPANILIDDEHAIPIITDFGLVLRNNLNEITLTQEGQLVGTPAYMSPEQAGAENDKVGFSSDIYSLGMILYELCTKLLPFTGSASQVIGQILTKEPDAPSLVNPEIIPELEQIILKAIAKKPSDRFSSMNEFAAALKNLQKTDTAEIAICQRKTYGFSKWWVTIGITILLLAAGTWIFFISNPSQTKLTETGLRKPGIPVASKVPSPIQQVDLLKEIQLPNDIVVGNWSMTRDVLTVNPIGFSRISIPVQTKADFRLEVELTRKLGHGEINVIFPVGSRSCMLTLGQNDWCGLAFPYGNKFGQQIPGHLLKGQRHKLDLKVSTNKSQAFIAAELNGTPILNWQGILDSLSLRSDWQVQQHSFGLGAHEEQVIFHRMLLHVDKQDQISYCRWAKYKTKKYQQPKNLLEEVNPSRHAFRGNWKVIKIPNKEQKTGVKQELTIDGGNDFATLILPVIPTGSYRLQIELTRTEGNGEINLILPIADDDCMISFGLEGNQFGIQNVSGKYWDMRKAGLFSNNKKQIILVDVTLEEENQVSIRFRIDEKEIFHWKGNRKELTIRDMWRIYPKAIGLGVDQDAIRFHKVLFQSRSGSVFQLEQK